MTVGRPFGNMHQESSIGSLQTIANLPFLTLHRKHALRDGDGLIGLVDLMSFIQTVVMLT